MEARENTIKLDYNTERERLAMPEYGRNILKMVEHLKEIEDRDKRSEQARAVVKSMEILNPNQKLWDHLYMIAGYDLDIDAPYPAPVPEFMEAKPLTIPLKDKPVKAAHYGRNIESIIDLIASEPEGEIKRAMLTSLAIYMRQQYLIWNKDSVADETIFKDIERLSDGRIQVPADITLSKISGDANFSRPGMGMNVGQAVPKKNKKQNNWRNKKK